jgi:aldehyde:ferredoxin oxidoreductase
LKQAFNIKHGIDPRSFLPGDRVIGKPAQTEGANLGRTLDIEKLISDYYRQFGWDPWTGRPTEESIDRLKLRGEEHGI